MIKKDLSEAVRNDLNTTILVADSKGQKVSRVLVLVSQNQQGKEEILTYITPKFFQMDLINIAAAGYQWGFASMEDLNDDLTFVPPSADMHGSDFWSSCGSGLSLLPEDLLHSSFASNKSGNASVRSCVTPVPDAFVAHQQGASTSTPVPLLERPKPKQKVAHPLLFFGKNLSFRKLFDSFTSLPHRKPEAAEKQQVSDMMLESSMSSFFAGDDDDMDDSIFGSSSWQHHQRAASSIRRDEGNAHATTAKGNTKHLNNNNNDDEQQDKASTMITKIKFNDNNNPPRRSMNRRNAMLPIKKCRVDEYLAACATPVEHTMMRLLSSSSSTSQPPPPQGQQQQQAIQIQIQIQRRWISPPTFRHSPLARGRPTS
jgi:hypothetical protein